MERSKFIKEYLNASDQLDRKRLKALTTKSIEADIDYGLFKHNRLIMVMEELSELSQQTAKVLRGRMDKIRLVEEMADVAICLKYLEETCDISTSDLYRAMNVKLDRLDNIMKEKGVYR